jgi:[ribosomal protein S5]-alanine N-acetyltransferase
MQLVLKSCTIRPWRLDDTVSLAKHANNRKIWLGLRDLFPHSYTSDDAHKFLQKAMDAEPVTNFCIEVEGPATGVIDIHLGQDVHRHTATLGYWVRRGLLGTWHND